MSRVGKNPIEIPKGVDVQINGQEITIKGKKGQLQQRLHPAIQVVKEENALKINGDVEIDEEANSLTGTTRALLNNMVKGVGDGFERRLLLSGTGYRATAKGNSVSLSLGFSHPVEVKMPEGVVAETPSNTEIILKGIDKQKVCQTAANIRAIRPPEPYKGKGVKYSNEVIIKKEGKKK